MGEWEAYLLHYLLRTAEMNVATAATSAAKAVSQLGSIGVLHE